MTTSIYEFGSKTYEPYIKECASNLILQIPPEFSQIEDPEVKEDSEFEIKMDFYDTVASINEFKSIWSIYEVLDFNETPFKNLKSICYNGNRGFSGTYAFEETPTWIQIWQACEKLIVDSHDLHHIFIEDIKDEGVLGIYSLQTGG